MKLHKFQILILILAIHLISNEPIEIINFSKNHYEGNTEFFYQFEPQNSLENEDTVYFFFSVSNTPFTSLNIYEDNGETKIKEISFNSYDVFYSAKIENRQSKKYIFKLRGNGEGELFFLDNSKEIDTNLMNFLNFNFKTEKEGTETNYPYPLIFNINNNEKTTVKFSELPNKDFYNSEYLLEYCKLDKNKCEYNGINENNNIVILEKGEKYKMKYNCIKESKAFYFDSYSSIDIKEIEFGYLDYFQLNSNHKEQYFMLKKDVYYIYYNEEKYNLYSIDIKYISENDKNDIDIITSENSFSEERYWYQNIWFLYSSKESNDYLVIRFKYKSSYNNKKIIGVASSCMEIEPDKIIEIKEGENAIIRKYSSNYNNFILVSSNENMKLINSSYISNSKNVLSYLDTEENNYIFIDSSNGKTDLKLFNLKINNIYQTDFKLYYNDYIQSYLDNYGPDSLFMRMSSHSSNLLFKYIYVYGLKEEYYLYKKRYYGNIDIYQYNKELNAFSNISLFDELYYQNFDDYNLMNDGLLNLNGFQLFTFYNSYGSLLDLYFQKVKDSDHITINENMFKFNNLVKILNEKKLYYLDFTVDHLIKLDNKFLDAEVIFEDSEGKKYKLNKSNKVIKDLKGDGIKVSSDKTALIYFYKKINDDSDILEIKIDSPEKGKVIQFDIVNKNNEKEEAQFFIIKDFGFSDYYPMISERSWNKVEGKSDIFKIYIENLYDKLENDDLYKTEGEHFIIYIYSFNKEKYEISNINYIDNLLTTNNKHYFEVIPANSNGVIILNGFTDIYNNGHYQFLMCKSKEISFKIDSSNGELYGNEYPITETINEDKQIIDGIFRNTDILIYSFKSDNEFLFSYSFNKYIESPNGLDYSIGSLFECKKNMIHIKFNPISEKAEKYYILIAKKDEINNAETFSDKCHVAKLLINNDPNSVIVKTLYINRNNDFPFSYDNIDITPLNLNDNKELVSMVIPFVDGVYLNSFSFEYQPKELSKIKDIKLEEEVNFDFEQKLVYKFEYNHKGDKNQKLSLIFGDDPYCDIYLTNEKGDAKAIFVNGKRDDAYFELSESGKYYLELFSINDYSQSGTFILDLPDKLIDIIDFSEKIYRNDKGIVVERPLDGKYYIVDNLQKDITIQFNYEKYKKKSQYLQAYEENPFVVCNNNTNKCENNVIKYLFKKGNKYTIFINYIYTLEDGYGFYYYPPFNFEVLNENGDKDDDDDDDDGSSSKVVIGVIFGIIAGCSLILAIFFIIKHNRRKNSIDYIMDTKQLNNAQILKE